MSNSVLTGLDVLEADDWRKLHGQKIALLVNQASVDRKYRHLVDLLHAHPKITLVRILAPEHGFRGEAQDMISVGSSVDPVTQVPIKSLYGDTVESLSPTKEDFEGVETLVVYLPDVGSRYYTFAQTMALCMRVAGTCGVRVLVLDRPNPIDGATIEGSALRKKFHSFCGMLPVPQRHGLTLGELAVAYESGFGIGEDAAIACRCQLEIIRAKRWSRAMYGDESDVPWVIPSVNMPTISTAIVYPGMCLFEGTNLSEGRGTTLPFELVGAPFIDGRAWAEATVKEDLELSGAILRPAHFLPQFQKCAGKVCGGVQIHVTDRGKYRSIRWAIAMLSALRKLYPTEFTWRTDRYEFIDTIPAIDLLYGSATLRETIDSGKSLTSIDKEMSDFETWYSEVRQPYLLYNA